MIKRSIHEEDITIINIYVPNIQAPKYVKPKQTELKGETNSNTIIVQDLISHFQQWIDHPDRELVKKWWI